MPSTCKAKQLNGKKYHCFFELTLLVIGGKWKPIILYHLAMSGVMRFSELRRSIPDITERMLTRQLRELEADDLLIRTVYKQVPPKVEYALTPMGRKLLPVLQQLRDWGAEYEQEQGGQFFGEEYERL
ncbi:winged helix-turn-helix transcriptional regulator [Desulfovibrio inopinatus]|uniref:winged helix-turn-helix transcriptional regulator n=1 Tax=Desulfovibrio inopinatus TaxID=102109 RepID=UPI0003F96298|nr:helix-turn-helix domain-containing protein [Desulfovibrio inopinatus]